MRRRLIRFLVGIGVFVLVGVGLEISARWYLATYQGNPLLVRHVSENRLAPYTDAPYWNAQFVREQQEVRQVKDYSGQYYKVVDYVRQTADQPDLYQSTVWTFGNSSLRDFEVPDAYTKASFLQDALNRDHPGVYRVVNLAAPGVNAAGQLLTLKQDVKIQKGDIVVFFDGQWDYAQRDLGERRQTTLFGRACQWLDRNAGDIALGYLYCRWSDQFIAPATMSQKEIDASAQQYQNWLIQADEYAKSQGAKFCHFLEPHLYTGPFTPWERQLTSNPLVTAPGEAEARKAAYPALQTVARDLAAQGRCSYDLTHSLDAIRASGVDVYVDDVHVTEQANVVIAKEIYQGLGLGQDRYGEPIH